MFGASRSVGYVSATRTRTARAASASEGREKVCLSRPDEASFRQGDAAENCEAASPQAGAGL